MKAASLKVESFMCPEGFANSMYFDRFLLEPRIS